jgi:GPI transamidase subunit PIG-U
MVSDDGSLFPSWIDDAVILVVLAVRLFAWAASTSLFAAASTSPSLPVSSSSSWADGPILASALIDPIFTLDHVQEAAAIRQLAYSQHRFVDAYQGSQIHLPPLCLAAIESIPPSLLGLVILVMDVRIAYNLFVYARYTLTREFIVDVNDEQRWQAVMDVRIQPTRLSHIFPTTTTTTATSSTSRGRRSGPQNNNDEHDNDNGENKPPVVYFAWDQLPRDTARLYLVVATGIALLYPTTFQNLPLFFLTEALAAQAHSIVWSAFALAMSSYLDLHNLLFLIPITLSAKTSTTPWMPVALFAIFIIYLQWLSHLLVGNANYWNVFRTTHLHSFRLVGMPPSLSILWYFAMQVFRRFTRYFTVMLSLTPYTVVAPLTIRLYKYPSVLVRLAQ